MPCSFRRRVERSIHLCATEAFAGRRREGNPPDLVGAKSPAAGPGALAVDGEDQLPVENPVAHDRNRLPAARRRRPMTGCSAVLVW